MARKSTIEKLKARISVLEKDRQRKVDEQIELILKTDPEILQINSQIDDLKKMVKASEELEYTLLEFLDDFSLSIPQYGTVKAKEGMEPVVVLTSNNYRDLSDALKRRCNYLYLPRKTKEEIVEILKMKAEASPIIIEGVASCLYQLQSLCLKQIPSISEGITWAGYLQKLMD